jgi:hypothetical protein
VSWPTIALVVLIGFLLERYNPISYLSYRLYLLAHQYGSSGGGAVHGGLQRSIIVPIFDEAVFRYFAINSLLLLGLSPIVAVGWSAVAYGLSHWSQWHDKRWTGGSSMNTALVLGFLLGVIAVTYGVLVSLAYHIASNLLYSLFRRFKGTSEGAA